MATISHLVKNIVGKRPFLEEVLARGLVNYVNLAKNLQPEIEYEIKKEVKFSAIMMALRRISESLEEDIVKHSSVKFRETDITVKSGLFEITVIKSQNIMNTIRKLYGLIDFSSGDYLTMTHGLYEVTIISANKHKNKIIKILEDEKITKIINNLSSLTIRIPIDAIETPGLFYILTKDLNWENINIVEIVSTLTELTFILKEEDVARAFNKLKDLTKEQTQTFK